MNLFILAAVGVTAFILIASTLPFKDKPLSTLFEKPPSHAVSPSSDTTPPTLVITNPADGAVVQGNTSLIITVSASDDREVTKVEFYIGDSLRCLILAPPYSCSWKVPSKPNAKYTIRAYGFDAASNVGSVSATVTSK